MVDPRATATAKKADYHLQLRPGTDGALSLELQPYSVVEIHPQTAREMEIEDGELVTVESLRGKIELKVKFTEELDRRVIFIPHGWDETNANVLTDNQALDPISSFPADRAFLARIVKK